MTHQPSSPRARVVRRLVLGALAFVVLGGPSPGFVGSCDPSIAGSPDAYRYCTDRSGLICSRELESGRIDEAQFLACYDAIRPFCETRRNWSGCVPTAAAVEACLNALRDASRFGLSCSAVSCEIVECNDLCASAGI
jgi:hypothetical protein